MPKLSERGVIAHLLLLLLLGAGLVIGVYLVSSGNPLKLFSKASMSKPVGPETSFTLVGPADCSGLMCLLPGAPQPQEEFSVKLYARSDIEGANLFEAKMKFPKDLIEVKEIKTEGGFIQNWVEEFYDNDAGEIDLTGGVAAPGYQTQLGEEGALVATIIFKAKALGKGTVSFTDSSAIYSNLNNINILTVKRGYDISIEVKPSPTPISTPAPTSANTPPSLQVNFVNSQGVPVNYESCGVYWSCNGGSWTTYNCQTSTSRTISIARSHPAGWCKGVAVPAKDLVRVTSNPEAGLKTDIKDRNLYGWENSWSNGERSLTFVVDSMPITQKGDGNKDGKINLIDMSILYTDWKPDLKMGKTIREEIDMNNDDVVNTRDALELREFLIKQGIIKTK